MTDQSERVLQSFCLFAIIWILGFQAFGLLNLFTAVPPFRAPWILAAALLWVAIWLLVDRPFRWFRLPRISELRLSFPIAVAIIAAAYLLFFLERLTAYPSGYDAIEYHLLNPVSWIQAASVRLVDLKWNMSLPANGELFALPAIALNAENIVFPGNLIGFVILTLAVYLVARRLSESKRGAELAVIVALSMPLVYFQTFYLNVDALGTAFLFAGLSFVLQFVETGQAKHALLCASCCGLSMGTKHVFVPYAGLVLLGLAVVLLRKKQTALIAAALIAAIAPLALWVCRNAAATGNPAYPFPLQIAGLHLPGAVGFPPFQIKTEPLMIQVQAASPDAAPPAEPASPSPLMGLKRLASSGGRISVNEDQGVGACFAAFSAAAILAAIAESFRRQRLPMIILTAACLILGLLWWRLIPVPRFGLPLFVLVAVFCSQLEPYFALAHRAILPVLLITTVGFGMALCLAVPAHRVWNRFNTHNWSRAGYYGYPELLDRLPAGSSVLDRSAGDRMGFAFVGAKLSNRIVHLEEPVTSSALTNVHVDYAVKEGVPDAEDGVFDRYGDLIYDGVPPGIFPKVVSRWRVYRMR